MGPIFEAFGSMLDVSVYSLLYILAALLFNAGVCAYEANIDELATQVWLIVMIKCIL